MPFLPPGGDWGRVWARLSPANRPFFTRIFRIAATDCAGDQANHDRHNQKKHSNCHWNKHFLNREKYKSWVFCDLWIRTTTAFTALPRFLRTKTRTSRALSVAARSGGNRNHSLQIYGSLPKIRTFSENTRSELRFKGIVFGGQVSYPLRTPQTLEFQREGWAEEMDMNAQHRFLTLTIHWQPSPNPECSRRHPR